VGAYILGSNGFDGIYWFAIAVFQLALLLIIIPVGIRLAPVR